VPLDSAFETPDTKRRYVRRLFATIAHRYDLITRVLSWGQDRRWKNRLLREAQVSSTDVAIDLACGTGDIAIGLRAHGARRVVGLDLTPAMLELARRRGPGIGYIAGDMSALPFGSGTADLMTAGYGLRNVPDLDAALVEVARVLRPGGRFLSLDFNRPESAAIRWAYLGYLNLVGGVLGWLLHRDPDTYRYIPASIRRYPGAAGVADRLRAHGFTEVRVVPLLFGLMSLHLARQSSRSIDRTSSVR